MPYYTGMNVLLQATFKNVSGADTDPTTITVYWKDPNGGIGSSVYVSSGTDNWTKTGTGLYAYDLPVSLPGPYTYGFQGSGAVAVYNSDQFNVSPRPVG